MFMDVSSELVHSLLPVFMVTVLGASMITVGLIEGIAEATAAFTRVFSGAISDHFGRRKLLVVLGYGLGAVAKPLFPLAPTIGWVFAGRFLDRIGKGIRGAPRDALIADITPPEQRGVAYGLRQSLDSVGAFIGPLLAIVFMALLGNDIQSVLWIAVVPAFVAVAILVGAVHEPARAKSGAEPRAPLRLAAIARLPRRYWLITLLGAVLTLARFSEAFLVLRAQDVGIALHYVPAVMVVMSVVFAIAAYPAGAMADRFSRKRLLIAGLSVLVVADIVLALADSPLLALLGAALWGLHMALTQGLLSVLVADAAPAELRGTAFGLFNLFSGGALLLASVIAGSLWTALGPPATFLAGAAFAGLATIGLFLYRSAPRTARP
jgi:MFS family permease